MKLSLKEIFIQGTRLVYSNLKFITIVWFANIAFAFALSLPIFTLLIDELSHSALSEKIYYEFDFLWFIQFQYHYETFFTSFPFLILVLVGIYNLIQTFFVGGFIAVFITSKKNHYVDFFYGGVKYFFRFIKVGLITFLFYLTIVAANLLFYSAIKNYVVTNNQLMQFIFHLFRYIIFIGLIGMANLVNDYAKVSLAVRDNYKSIKTINEIILFIKMNWLKIIPLYFGIASFIFTAAIIYNLLDSFVPRYPIFLLIVTFIIQQLLIIFRIIIKMLFYATEIILYKDLNAEVVQMNVEIIN